MGETSSCPDPKFQNFLRRELDSLKRCLSKKVSWTMLGVVVTGIGLLATLVYTAYSGEQHRQCREIDENARIVREVRIDVKVMETEYKHVRKDLKELKTLQKSQFNVILEELKQIKERGGASE